MSAGSSLVSLIIVFQSVTCLLSFQYWDFCFLRGQQIFSLQYGRQISLWIPSKNELQWDHHYSDNSLANSPLWITCQIVYTVLSYIDCVESRLYCCAWTSLRLKLLFNDLFWRTLQFEYNYIECSGSCYASCTKLINSQGLFCTFLKLINHLIVASRNYNSRQIRVHCTLGLLYKGWITYLKRQSLCTDVTGCWYLYISENATIYGLRSIVLNLVLSFKYMSLLHVLVSCSNEYKWASLWQDCLN